MPTHRFLSTLQFYCQSDDWGSGRQTSARLRLLPAQYAGDMGNTEISVYMCM